MSALVIIIIIIIYNDCFDLKFILYNMYLANKKSAFGGFQGKKQTSYGNCRGRCSMPN